MEAIGRAIEWATTANIPDVVVFSDSLGSVESGQQTTPAHGPDVCPRRLRRPDEVFADHRLDTWSPRDTGQRDLCKRALHHDAVDIPTTLEYREARSIYRGFFLRKWQAEWATSATGSHYRALEPTVTLAR